MNLDEFGLNPLIIGSMIITRQCKPHHLDRVHNGLNPLIIGSMIITFTKFKIFAYCKAGVLIPLSSGQ